MKWTAADNYEDMCRITAKRMFDVISQKLKHENPVNIGMATGNTMIGLYEILSGMLNAAGTNLSRMHTFNLDEYVGGDGKNVLPDHPLSYRRYMKEKFFDLLDPKLGFKETNMHFPDAINPAEYDREIEAAGGLDFQLLGIGFNGHIGFNEPISAKEISAADFAILPSHVVELDKLTIQTNARLTAGNDSKIVPAKAVTMGMASILKAKEIMLLACFTEQRAPLLAIKTGTVTPELPASFILRHKNSEIIYTENNIKM